MAMETTYASSIRSYIEEADTEECRKQLKKILCRQRAYHGIIRSGYSRSYLTHKVKICFRLLVFKNFVVSLHIKYTLLKRKHYGIRNKNSTCIDRWRRWTFCTSRRMRMREIHKGEHCFSRLRILTGIDGTFTKISKRAWRKRTFCKIDVGVFHIQ